MYADPLVHENKEPFLLPELSYVDEFLKLKESLSFTDKNF